MKIVNRKTTFKGNYYGTSQTLETKDIPIWLRIYGLIELFLLIAGIVVTILQSSDEVMFLLSICTTIGIVFSTGGIWLKQLCKLHEIQKIEKTVCNIFIVIGFGILALIFGTQYLSINFLSRYGVICILLLLFLFIGVRLTNKGFSEKKALKTCTYLVWAKCEDYEEISPYINRLGDDELPVPINRASSTKTMYRPIWTYDFNNVIYHSYSQQYSHKKVVEVGERKQIYIDPKHPMQLYYCGNTGYQMLIMMGISFIFISLLCFIVFLIIF